MDRRDWFLEFKQKLLIIIYVRILVYLASIGSLGTSLFFYLTELFMLVDHGSSDLLDHGRGDLSWQKFDDITGSESVRRYSTPSLVPQGQREAVLIERELFLVYVVGALMRGVLIVPDLILEQGKGAIDLSINIIDLTVELANS